MNNWNTILQKMVGRALQNGTLDRIIAKLPDLFEADDLPRYEHHDKVYKARPYRPPTPRTYEDQDYEERLKKSIPDLSITTTDTDTNDYQKKVTQKLSKQQANIEFEKNVPEPIRLFNQFLICRKEYNFSSDLQSVYLELFQTANSSHWRNPISIKDDLLCATCNIGSRHTLQTYRNKLKQAGLIDFKTKQGVPTKYYFILAEDSAKEETEKLSKQQANIASIRYEFEQNVPEPKYFSYDEMLYMGGKHYNKKSHAYGLNRFPPKKYWGNIAQLFKLLDHIRATVQHPIHILSGYRSPEYNKAVGGETKSQHTFAAAADIFCPFIDASTLATIIKTIRLKGKFKGGIGTYTNFVHVDIRGYNTNWNG